MTIKPLRTLGSTPLAPVAEDWLARIDHALRDAALDRPRFCRELLCELAFPAYAANWDTAIGDTTVPVGTRLSLAALDPRNITLEPEYYAECDDAKFQRA